MSEKVFLDTSFIIALAFDNDENNKRAVEFKNILSEDCYINNSIVNEVVTVSNNKGDSTKAGIMFNFLVDNFTIINEYNIINYNDKTMFNFNNHNGKLSFTDSGIITTMVEHDIKKLVTFDKAFKKEDQIEVIAFK
ncbi:type II toxin-antitoxin system VapC family toxin [Methanobrevibacter sp.]|uniref:type II toxin-antitoxin system VapC family toxin n=1 Tax=Methanobrevibacter sp. TaxID=66852 RepID=UPI0038660932